MSGRPRLPTRLLVLTATAAVVAGLLVAALVLRASPGRRSRPRRYHPFRVGLATDLADQIRAGGPVFFPDPLRGDRGFYLALVDGRFVALHVVRPGVPRCLIGFDRRRGRFTDCLGGPVDPAQLDRYGLRLTGRAGAEVVEVDLRRVERAPPPTRSPVSTHGTGSAVTPAGGGAQPSPAAHP